MAVQLDKAIGALTIGTWTNYMLFTLELLQAVSYFQNYWHDHWILRGAVVSALVIDTVGTLSNSVGVYNITIKHFGREEVFLTQGPEIPLYCITAGLSGLICQSYLTWRFYRLSKNRLLTGLLLTTSVVATAFAIFTAHQVIKYNEYAQRARLVTPVIIWLVLEVASDIAIAGALVFFLLMLIAVESGSVSSLVASIVLITYLTDLESNVTVGIGFNLGRIYSLTLLFNLNMRKSGLLAAGSSERGAGAKGSVFTFAVGTKAGTGMRSTAGNQEGISMVPIEVRHEVQIRTEGGRDDDDETRYKSDDVESQIENEKS